MTHILLLRGVNVGGKNRLPMKDLAAIVTAAGAREVRTVIQSGNVVCDIDPAGVRPLCRAVERALLEQFGIRTPVIERAQAELRAALALDPFGDRDHTHIAFLADVPAAGRTLDPDRSPGDRFEIHGRDVYLHLPNGVARTKLTNDWLDRSLGTTSTIRNLRTVGALCS